MLQIENALLQILAKQCQKRTYDAPATPQHMKNSTHIVSLSKHYTKIVPVIIFSDLSIKFLLRTDRLRLVKNRLIVEKPVCEHLQVTTRTHAPYWFSVVWCQYCTLSFIMGGFLTYPKFTNMQAGTHADAHACPFTAMQTYKLRAQREAHYSSLSHPLLYCYGTKFRVTSVC